METMRLLDTMPGLTETAGTSELKNEKMEEKVKEDKDK